MIQRRSIVAAVAAMSLGFGTVCTLVRADDTAQDKQTQDKNPAAVPDKNKTDNGVPAAPISQQQLDDLQKQEQMQDKMKSDLMSSFNDADFVKVASMANQDEIQAIPLAAHDAAVRMIAEFSEGW